MNAIEIQGLEKHYRDFDLRLDLELPEGCILGLIGENGAGKTTAIKAILGAIRPDAGQIRVLGQDNRRDFAALRAQIGVVLDEPGFPDCVTALQLGRILAGVYPNWDEEVYRRNLRRLDLPEGKPFRDFSRGMRMKLAIAAALSHHAKLLVLDEPTSGLDPLVRDQVVELFSDFTRQEDHSVLISSHIVSDLEKLCDYVAFLHKGRLLLYEEKDALRERYGLCRLSREDFRALEPSAVLGHRDSPYGVSAILRRDAVPASLPMESVSVEDLFLVMAKEGEQ